jgi:hypothetical protein
VIEHVPQLVRPVALDGLIGTENRVDRGPQSFRSIDNEQPLLLRIDAPRHDILQQLSDHGGVLRSALA